MIEPRLYTISHHQRPDPSISDRIVALATLLTGRWFTPNVPEDTRRDLLFQDALCLFVEDRLTAFLVFTSFDGLLQITLMGTHPEYQGQGYGSLLLERLEAYAMSLGFTQILAMTVPPEVNAAYESTLQFYLQRGFVVTRRYTELWEQGAIALTKNLS